MKEASKHPTSAIVTSSSDLRGFFSFLRMRRTKLFLYGFFFAFIAYTAYIAFNPTAVADASAPWYNNLLASASTSTAPYRSQISSLFSYIFPNSSSPVPEKEAPLPEKTAGIDDGSEKCGILVANETSKGVEVDAVGTNRTELAVVSQENGSSVKNESAKGAAVGKGGGLATNNQTDSGIGPPGSVVTAQNLTRSGTTLQSSGDSKKNQTDKGGSGVPTAKDEAKDGVGSKGIVSAAKNQTVSGVAEKNQTTSGVTLTGNGDKKAPSSSPQVSGSASKNQSSTNTPTVPNSSPVAAKNLTITSATTAPKSSPMVNNKSVTTPAATPSTSSEASKQSGSATASAPKISPTTKNESAKGTAPSAKTSSSPAPVVEKKGTSSVETKVSNLTSSLTKGNGSPTLSKNGAKKMEDWIKEMKGCDIFHGKWVKDDSYPMYPEGSCPHIDEPFDCYRNGRPDRAYQKLRWQPNGCNIPRLNATDMLERLRGKRLVYVGDSLNRNMWESLVCILRNSVKDKKKVFEASGRREFRTEGSYSFLFKDYNCTVEFFRSPFLVQEWEAPVSKGKTKETLRLDIIEQHSSKYKNADIIIFNTGHWWTHEKTSKGKDYYQEGNHVYGELNVVEAFHKALNTWAKWVDTNVNSKKTLVLFRGYSASHFSGGQWNSGGQCDKETEPIVNEKYLSVYPPKMGVLESVLKGMKTPVSYLNITRMTDYRKDAHPSIYRKQNLSEEERRSPERYQDCSHWCLPGVPDSWNELLYAQLLLKQH